MHGLMQDWPLTVDKFLDHAKNWHGDREIVSRSVEGPIVRTTYAAVHDRAKRISSALVAMGIKAGDRVATLAWNTGRHIEAWYGIMGIGAVCHTLNPRLFADQLCYIINHAEDRIIFTDLTFVGTLAEHLHKMPTVEHIVIMTDPATMPAFTPAEAPPPSFKGVLCFEELATRFAPDAAWGEFGEETAAGLCYTSGTTGNPKGVLYSHRSNFLHTMIALQADVMGLSARDTILPIVPMFHANAWGIAFSAPAVGAKLVMPGMKLDGASVHELLETEGVTFSAAVPTVWQGLLQHLDATGARLTTLKRVVIGGSACPESIIRAFHDKYGVDVIHAWGMTETSPLGTLGTPTADVARLSFDEQMAYKLKQGRAPMGVEMKLTDDDGRPLPHDGETYGRLKVRGSIVAGGYFKGEGGNILDEAGFFDTGDVATIDPEGYMQITDRAKDVIKSGGEWISSIEIENIAVGHPKAELAAVIGVAHPKWDERPLLLVKLKPGESATKEEFLQFLEGKIAKWWMPDDVVFVDDIPLGATGKIDKKLIRQRMEGYVLPAVAAAAGGAVAEAAARAPVIYAPEEEAEAEAPDPFPGEAAVEASPDPATPPAEATGPAEPPLDIPLFVTPSAPRRNRRRTDRGEGRAKAAAAGPSTLLLDIILVLAFVPAIMVLGGAMATRFGVVDWSDGFTRMLLGGAREPAWAYVAALAALVAAVGGFIYALFTDFARLWSRATTAVAVVVVTLAGFMVLHAQLNRHPPIHDVATDWTQPLTFSSALTRARGAGNEVELDPVVPLGAGAWMGRRVADVNAETCPGARPVILSKTPAQAYEAAKAAARHLGVAITGDDPANGRFEGTDTSLVYGFKDDIAVRVRPEGQGSRVDIRSTSRELPSDLGANCQRVTAFANMMGG